MIELQKGYLKHLEANASALHMSCPTWEDLTSFGYDEKVLSKRLDAIYLKIKEFIEKIGEQFPMFKWSSLLTFQQWSRDYKLKAILPSE